MILCLYVIICIAVVVWAVFQLIQVDKEYKRCLKRIDEWYQSELEWLEEQQTGWTPVSEKPKENGKYIVSLEDSVYPWANFFNGKWFMLSNGIAREFGEYEVIAWMPLPEPYGKK